MPTFFLRLLTHIPVNDTCVHSSRMNWPTKELNHEFQGWRSATTTVSNEQLRLWRFSPFNPLNTSNKGWAVYQYMVVSWYCIDAVVVYIMYVCHTKTGYWWICCENILLCSYTACANVLYRGVDCFCTGRKGLLLINSLHITSNCATLAKGVEVGVLWRRQ